MKKAKVSMMKSQATGKPVKNHFVIETDEGKYLHSYESVIVFIPNDKSKPVQLGKDWDYSNTTGKYRNMFLGETKRETEAKLASGEYVLNYDL